MKKKIQLNKKTIKKLKLQLRPKNDRKAAPAVLLELDQTDDATNGTGCDFTRPIKVC
jgi:hypothetical protein